MGVLQSSIIESTSLFFFWVYINDVPVNRVDTVESTAVPFQSGANCKDHHFRGELGSEVPPRHFPLYPTDAIDMYTCSSSNVGGRSTSY